MPKFLYVLVSVSISILSLPLVFRKIPMNSIYGIRFSQSFKSKKNWYDINAAGGRVLILWNIPIFLIGLKEIFIAPKTYMHILITNIFVVCCLLIACLQSYKAALRIDKENA